MPGLPAGLGQAAPGIKAFVLIYCIGLGPRNIQSPEEISEFHEF